MTFTDFLTALGDVLDSTRSDEPVGGSLQPSLQALYDPSRQQADAPALILIGVGQWQRDAHLVDHLGVCLNNKGLRERFGARYHYPTVTDLVLDPPQPLREHWEQLASACRGPKELLEHFTLIVEDAGPDSCLALLCWLARCSGVEASEFLIGRGRPWVQAVRQWESTGMVVDPSTAWSTLLSTLGHSFLSMIGASDARSAISQPDVSQAWREALKFTVALLREEVDPEAVPPVWHLSGYVRARAFLDVERHEYLQSLEQATCLQLWVPLSGTGGTRRLLVDAYFATETWPSGVRKIFVRTDREHSHLKQGFAVMGLYRPNARGSGGDMTLSVNPWTGIDLQLLWAELERLETERWQGNRPRDNVRRIASYPNGTGYNQPWWDDSGRYTLIGAPKALPGWPSGSQLTWTEVVEAAWQCYSPLADLQLYDLLSGTDCSLSACQCDVLPGTACSVTKHLVTVRWHPDDLRPQSLLLTPTAQRAMAALVARGPSTQPLRLSELPAETDLLMVPMTSGFAVLHQCGVLLFDDWRDEPLPATELIEEIQRCARWLGTIHEVDRHLAARRHVNPNNDGPRRTWQTVGTLADLAAQRSRLANARDKNALASADPEVRRFRAKLDAWWGLDDASKELQCRLTQMEDAIRTTSTLRTQGLVQILSVYGLPFAISGGITSQLAPLIDAAAVTMPGDAIGASLFKLGIYVALAIALIVVMRLTQEVWIKAVTRLPGQPPPSTRESTRPTR